MKIKKNSQDWKDCETVLNCLSIKSDCYDTMHQHIVTKYIACCDDDPASAIGAAFIYHELTKCGHEPVVLCVGGLGLLSQFMDIPSEADRLASFCKLLGVPNDKIVILSDGRNTGENIREIAKHVADDFGDITFCLTKRLSLRFERSFKKQFPKFYAEAGGKALPHDYYHVLEDSLDDTCNWVNAKAADGNRMMLHEIASIYPRCLEYSGKFQLPIDTEKTPISPEVIGAAQRLAKRYRLKIGGKMGLREYIQWFRLRVSLNLHGEEIMTASYEAILNAREELNEKFGIKFPDLEGPGVVS